MLHPDAGIETTVSPGPSRQKLGVFGWSHTMLLYILGDFWWFRIISQNIILGDCSFWSSSQNNILGIEFLGVPKNFFGNRSSWDPKIIFWEVIFCLSIHGVLLQVGPQQAPEYDYHSTQPLHRDHRSKTQSLPRDLRILWTRCPSVISQEWKIGRPSAGFLKHKHIRGMSTTSESTSKVWHRGLWEAMNTDRIIMW